jgi:hypothetical protein
MSSPPVAPVSEKVSEQLERWLSGDGEKTLASLIELFEEKSFAILFVVGVTGVVLEIVLGSAAINGIGSLF